MKSEAQKDTQAGRIGEELKQSCGLHSGSPNCYYELSFNVKLKTGVGGYLEYCQLDVSCLICLKSGHLQMRLNCFTGYMVSSLEA